MIRIAYMSDLHLEMERPFLSVPGWAGLLRRRREFPGHPRHGPLLDGLSGVDLVVMAGDIHKGLRGAVYAAEVAAFLGAPVVMVAGNHEFYHHDMETLLPALGKVGGEVRVLENGAAVFEVRGRRVHVLGATLWSDFALGGDAPAGMMAAQQRMNDFRYIHLDGRDFTPMDAAGRHEVSRVWLHGALAAVSAAEPEAVVVVVTHHAPSGRFVGARVGAVAPAYASEMLGGFAGLGVDLWVHGHTHFRHDSVAEGIRVVSAPRGYVGYDGEEAVNFRPGVVEID